MSAPTAATAPTATTIERAFRAAAVLLGAGCILYLVLLVLDDLGAGGRSWRQGDWLINAVNQPIRRGPFGSAVLAAADTLALSPVTLVVALQAGLIVALGAIVLRVIWRLPHRPAYALLLVSPAFFPVFWVADPHGALRKELIAYVAMALPLLRPVSAAGRGALLALSGGLFAVGCVAHEATVFLLPAYAAILAVAFRPDPRSPAAWLAGAALAGAAGLAFLYAARHSGVADAAGICAPLLQRGLDPELCEGPIAWLALPADEGLDEIGAGIIGTASGLVFPLAYLLALAPLLYLVALHREAGRLALALVVLALPILPLFVVAVDWGRWMSLHVTSFGLLLLALACHGRLSPGRPARPAVLAGLGLAGLLWAPSHAPNVERYMAGVVPGGLVAEVLGTARERLPGTEPPP